MKQAARWIWYPGDYGIWWGNTLQSRRLQRGARYAPFWALYEPHTRVVFKSPELKLEADEELEIHGDGALSVAIVGADGKRRDSSVLLGRFTLSKDAVRLEIKMQNTARPPALWVNGPSLQTDDTWDVTWHAVDSMGEIYRRAESSARFVNPLTPPGLQGLPTREVQPVWMEVTPEHHVMADFGEETYGYLRLKDIRGNGAVKVIYAESEPEMRAEEYAITDPWGLDGWEMVAVNEGPDFRLPIPYGLRYAHIIPVSGDLHIGGVTLDYEWKDVPIKGSFRCNDEEINRIWDVSAKTLGLTCREVFIEGIKRDHWLWGGDSAQSFLMNYYVFGDYDGCRDTLWALRGKDPIPRHINHIMDYTFYWFDAVERYWLYSGNPNFAQQIYPRMKSLMAFVIGRLDENGRPVDRRDDWMFIDWAPVELPNHGGVTSFEQMLLVRALEATARMAREVGEDAEAQDYETRAEKLRAEIVPLFWNEEKGGLMHLLKNDGTHDPLLTRYPNMFGLFYGYFDETQKQRVVQDVLLNESVPMIQTPYMRFYELEAFCALGMQTNVTQEIKQYWGAMLKLGATSFWELYNPEQKDLEHYAMYGRPFGRSLCHAWGASPAYLLGRYYLGVTPTSPGFATYEVKPNLGGLEWMEGDVPTPWGRIHVRVDATGTTVTEIRDA